MALSHIIDFRRHWRAICYSSVFVRLSVCPSVTTRYYGQPVFYGHLNAMLCTRWRKKLFIGYTGTNHHLYSPNMVDD